MIKDPLTYKVIGWAMKVRSSPGNGFPEVIYRRCFEIEMNKAGLSFEKEVNHKTFYEGVNVGTTKADFVVENKLILELKAIIDLDDSYLAQAKNYVFAYAVALGLLINFGSTSLEHKLIFNQKYNQAISKNDSANPQIL